MFPISVYTYAYLLLLRFLPVHTLPFQERKIASIGCEGGHKMQDLNLNQIFFQNFIVWDQYRV